MSARKVSRPHTSHKVRRIVGAAATWIAILACIFMMLVGRWTVVNWIGAVVLAAIAAAAMVPLMREGLFGLRVDWRWCRFLPSAVIQIFVDFSIITLALARSLATGQREIGRFVARPQFPTGGKDPSGTAWRAFITVATTLSPNSYVVDIDPETGNRLSHDLVPNRSSERPA